MRYVPRPRCVMKQGRASHLDVFKPVPRWQTAGNSLPFFLDSP